jgi:hypothetical protein
VKIIGLTGKAGAGKDAVAEAAIRWCKENNLSAERVAFADPLKVSAARALGAPIDLTAEQCVEFCNELKQPEVEIAVLKRHKESVDVTQAPLVSTEVLAELSGREFLQFYGTEAHRDVFDREFWVNATMDPLDARFRELRAPDVVFITDCRFPNEASAVNERGGEVWEVVRPALEEANLGKGQPRGQLKLNPDEEQHSSEQRLPDGAIEFQIHNDGSLEDLRTLIGSVCESNLKEGA